MVENEVAVAGHTAGPWRIASSGMVEMGDAGSRLSFWAGLGYGGQLPNPSGQDAREELNANARLIAAAPELLEAAQNAEQSIITMYSAIAGGDANAGQRFADNDPAVAKLRAAIAKATVNQGQGDVR